MENQVTLQMIDDMVVKINEMAKTLNSEFIYFKDTQQTLRTDKTEAAYFNNIDYYYILFYERGDIFNTFIGEKIRLYELDYKNVTSCLDIIHDLRTYKSHRIDRKGSRGQKIEEQVKRWYFDNVGTKHPSAEKKVICIPILDKMAYLILENIYKCLVRISEDSRKETMIYDMQMVRDKYLPDFVIIEETIKVIENMQIQADPYTVVKKFGSQIKKRMEMYTNTDAQKRHEILKLCIEQIMVENRLGICPLSYEQIKDVYKNRTVSELGALKKRAVQISDENMFLNAEEILEKLLVEDPL